MRISVLPLFRTILLNHHHPSHISPLSSATQFPEKCAVSLTPCNGAAAVRTEQNTHAQTHTQQHEEESKTKKCIESWRHKTSTWTQTTATTMPTDDVTPMPMRRRYRRRRRVHITRKGTASPWVWESGCLRVCVFIFRYRCRTAVSLSSLPFRGVTGW